MKVIRTSKCNSLGHPEFRITFDPLLVPVGGDAEWLIDWLEETVASGTHYQPGQTCQIGWTLTEIRSHENGDLTLWEPDMRSMPIHWVEGVSKTLAFLRLQKDVVESVMSSDDLSFPSLRQSAIVCSRFGPIESMVLDRTPPKGSASGWFFGCREKNHDHNDVSELKCISLYEAAVKSDSRIVPYLALPPGVLISASRHPPVVFREGQRLEFKPGSMLALRAERLNK